LQVIFSPEKCEVLYS